VTPERFAKIQAVLARRQPDMTLVADFVNKDRNFSALVRTADAVGMLDIHSVNDRDDFFAYSGTAKGSHRWVNVQHHRSVASAVAPLRAQGMQILAADVGEHCVDYRDIDYAQPFALLLGAEKQGLSTAARAETDVFINIAMVGMVESLNVSVAAAIILNEAMQQRRAAGCYARAALMGDKLTRQLFEYCHPEVQAFCQRNGLAYPPMRDDGEIDQPAQWYAPMRLVQVKRCRLFF
jgi:tRNA (guanosine-2'-O-)-methyltransferase